MVIWQKDHKQSVDIPSVLTEAQNLAVLILPGTSLHVHITKPAPMVP